MAPLAGASRRQTASSQPRYSSARPRNPTPPRAARVSDVRPPRLTAVGDARRWQGRVPAAALSPCAGPAPRRRGRHAPGVVARRAGGARADAPSPAARRWRARARRDPRRGDVRRPRGVWGDRRRVAAGVAVTHAAAGASRRAPRRAGLPPPAAVLP
ncbi:hypothetical protein BU14_0087s0002 [Porphyra umbilicalis]|uniref:Uncharacterized protein n=1 Tax=Porphyra umbilicalis TaxID=2786 RepID=A0A1X6PDW6_PORUM|nr:hypothetical protein BU14_0087s0002 [Porphyra umbilicalis]|eukprot:OSX79052.1 hypothetical protein BU14_0087s0002 [Porphyra umbilicalis]